MIKLKKGKPRHGATIKSNMGYGDEITFKQALDAIPQLQTPVSKDGWSRSYLISQVLKTWYNHPDFPPDYTWEDLERIKEGKIIV